MGPVAYWVCTGNTPPSRDNAGEVRYNWKRRPFGPGKPTNWAGASRRRLHFRLAQRVCRVWCCVELTEIALFSRVGVAVGTLAAMLAATMIFVGHSVIQVARGMRRRTNGHCVECGYNLTGLPSPRCPECGHRF